VLEVSRAARLSPIGQKDAAAFRAAAGGMIFFGLHVGNGPKRLPSHDLQNRFGEAITIAGTPEMSGEIGQFEMSQCLAGLQLLPHRTGNGSLPGLCEQG